MGMGLLISVVIMKLSENGRSRIGAVTEDMVRTIMNEQIILSRKASFTYVDISMLIRSFG